MPSKSSLSISALHRDVLSLVRDERSDEAIARWVDASKPQDAEVLSVIAAAYVELGDAHEALRLAKIVLATSANHPAALLASARALQRLKRTEEALGSWLRLLRAKPEHPGATNAVRKAAERNPENAELADALRQAERFLAYAPEKLRQWSPIQPLAEEPTSDPTSLYLDLMVRTVSGWILEDGAIDPGHPDGRFDRSAREIGADWPRLGHSMAGLRRLQQLREACETVLRNGIVGDFVEAGVWRGGACILMRACLAVHNDSDRSVWVADSFAGVPGPTYYAPEDEFGVAFHQYTELAVPRSIVAENFKRYGLLDKRVKFLEGLFSETLMASPIECLSILRLDGDLYSSTMETLEALYPRVSPGGYVIIDDYGVVAGARRATLDYREANCISNPIVNIDGIGAFWRKGP